MMRILLVRHGQSEWNASHRLQGQADISLTDLGRSQAGALRASIEDISPCRAVTSDLKRTRETAAQIGAADAKPLTSLREIDVGDWTGERIEELIKHKKDAYLAWRAGTGTPRGGEAWTDFADRVTATIEQEAKHPCKNLLVVCHGGVIRAILQRYIELQPANIIPTTPASLTALRLSIGGAHPAKLELFNYRPNTLDLNAPD